MSAAHTAVTVQAGEVSPQGPCGEDNCGIRGVLDRIGDKWSVLVIVELSKGVRRFGELQRAVPGISPRMLTLTTRRLCRDGLVERTGYPTIPPQVDYRLTGMGAGLAGMVSALADWSRDHHEAIAAAQNDWDLAHPEDAGA